MGPMADTQEALSREDILKDKNKSLSCVSEEPGKYLLGLRLESITGACADVQ